LLRQPFERVVLGVRDAEVDLALWLFLVHSGFYG
jgi:hypothetical protein